MRWKNKEPVEMRFKIGDRVWEEEWEGEIKEVEITKVLPKTDRYQVKEKNYRPRFVDSQTLYVSREEYFKERIKRLDKSISELQEEKQKCFQEIRNEQKKVRE